MKKYGFTVLELLVVIIIIGVLTSLALPRMWNLIEVSKSAEAMGRISQIRRAMESCYLQKNGNYWKCYSGNLRPFVPDLPYATVAGLDGAFVGEHFMYEIGILCNSSSNPDYCDRGYWINAHRTRKTGGGEWFDVETYESNKITVVVCDYSQKIKTCGFGSYESLSDKGVNCQYLADCE